MSADLGLGSGYRMQAEVAELLKGLSLDIFSHAKDAGQPPSSTSASAGCLASYTIVVDEVGHGAFKIAGPVRWRD